MADVVAEPDRCEHDGALDAACLAEVAGAAPVAADPTDPFRRARALYRLAVSCPL